MSRDILDAPADQARELMTKNAKVYQVYNHDSMLPRLWNMNNFWYTTFRDHRLFDALTKCFWACGVDTIDTHYKNNFDESDLRWLVGAGNDDFQALCAAFFAIVDPTGTGPVDDQTAEEVRKLGEAYVTHRTGLFPANKRGRYLRKYDDGLKLVEGKRDRDVGGNCSALKCRKCKTWVHDAAEACPICGTSAKTVEGKGALGIWPGKWLPPAHLTSSLVTLPFVVPILAQAFWVIMSMSPASRADIQAAST
jgi:hypothetical protein